LSYYHFTLITEATRLVVGHISDSQSTASYCAGLDLILEQHVYLLWQRDCHWGNSILGLPLIVIPLALPIHFLPYCGYKTD